MHELTLFNERVNRLDRSELARQLEAKALKLDYEKMIKREWVSAQGITEASVDAFVLNLRLLIQDRDGISIRCLSKNIYSQETVPSNLRNRFEAERSRWKDFLDGESVFAHPSESRNFNKRELFEIIIYGGLAHVDPDKYQQFRDITNRGAFSSLLFGWFLHALGLLLEILRKMRDVNQELLGLSVNDAVPNP